MQVLGPTSGVVHLTSKEPLLARCYRKDPLGVEC